MTATVYLSDLVAAIAAVCVCIVGLSFIVVAALILSTFYEDWRDRRRRPSGQVIDFTRHGR
jgi:peptidoglycan/LPS O-acetylase OafA/YrhL